jgi:hypothetical protein
MKVCKQPHNKGHNPDRRTLTLGQLRQHGCQMAKQSTAVIMARLATYVQCRVVCTVCKHYENRGH